MKDLSDDWRNFRRHLGIYLVVVVTFMLLNLFLLRGYWYWYWSLGIALLWGIGVAIHWLTMSTETMYGAWKDFVRHAGVYAIVIGSLGMLNLIFLRNVLLFQWLALLWGASVAIHLLVAATEDRPKDDQSAFDKQFDNEQADQAINGQDVVHLADDGLQTKLNQALLYATQINQLMNPAGQTRLPARLREVAAQVNEWTESVKHLAGRVDTFKRNDLIQQDLETVPEAIAQLKRQLAGEVDPEIKATLERTLANRRNQLASLRHLQQLMNRAEIQMESTVSSLGTIYSQLLTSQSTNQVADYDHLSVEAEEQTRILQDHLEALEEVRLGRTV
jgi:hypothetical protein